MCNRRREADLQSQFQARGPHENTSFDFIHFVLWRYLGSCASQAGGDSSAALCTAYKWGADVDDRAAYADHHQGSGAWFIPDSSNSDVAAAGAGRSTGESKYADGALSNFSRHADGTERTLAELNHKDDEPGGNYSATGKPNAALVCG